MPELVIEGSANEYGFADVRDAVPNYEPLESPFNVRQGSVASGNQRAGEGAQAERLFNVGVGGARAAVGSKESNN